MKELTNEIRAKVFAMYLGQRVRLNSYNYSALIIGVDLKGKVALDKSFAAVEECKLILRPLSAISDEDAIEVARIPYASAANSEDGANLAHCLIAQGVDEYRYVSAGAFAAISQLLISKGYSVPLHILDGQDPLTANLAITPEQVKSIQS